MVEPLDDDEHDIGQDDAPGGPRRRKRRRRRPREEAPPPPADEEDLNPVAAFLFGAFFLGCGVLMLLNMVRGETEVDGGGIFALVLGDTCFAFVAMVICLLIGVCGVVAPFLSSDQAERAEAARDRRERALERAARKRAQRKMRRRRPGGDEDEAPRRSASGSLLLECPHCGETSRIPAKYAGKKGRCPKCDSGIRAPDR